MHLFGASCGESLPIFLACVHLALIAVLLREYFDRWRLEDGEFLAELLINITIDGADTEDAEHFLSELNVHLLHVLTLFLVRVEEHDGPDLLPTIESRNRTEVHCVHVSVLEKVRLRWRFVMLLVEATVMASEGITTAEVEVELMSTSSSSSTKWAAAPEELRENVVGARSRSASLLLLLDTFFAELIVSLALLGVRENLISICYLLELDLGTFGIVLVFVRMKLDSHFLELLLYLGVAGISLHAEHFIVVLALLLLLLTATTTSKAMVSAAKTLMEVLLSTAAASSSSVLESELSLDEEA